MFRGSLPFLFALLCLLVPHVCLGGWFSTAEAETGAPIITIPHLPPGHPFATPAAQHQLQQPILHQQPIVQQQPILQQQPIVPQQPVMSQPVTQPILTQPVVEPVPTMQPVIEQQEEEQEQEPEPQRPAIGVTPELHEQPELEQVHPQPKLTREPAVSIPQPPEKSELGMPTARPVKQTSPLACPAIEFKHDFRCSSGECLLSFINLTPNVPVDWVDAHITSSSIAALKLAGILSGSSHPTAALPSVQMNHRMRLAAGEFGKMHSKMPEMTETMDHPMPREQIKLSSALAQQLLGKHQATQVWQFPVPLAFTDGKELKVKFTYCANGVDCDTEELSLLKLAAAVTKKALQCPAISYQHAFSCSSGRCLVSFMNLSPELPLDWVDLHLKSNSPVLMQAVGVTSQSSTILPQVNFRMKLAAGPAGRMHGMPMKMNDQEEDSSMAESVEKFGSGEAIRLQQSHGAAQVFQFAIPLSYAAGEKLRASFTYCANGLDCDTEEFDLKEAGEKKMKFSELDSDVQPVKSLRMSPSNIPIQQQQELSQEESDQIDQDQNQNLNPNANNLFPENINVVRDFDRLRLGAAEQFQQPIDLAHLSRPIRLSVSPRQQMRQSREFLPVEVQNPASSSLLVGLSSSDVLMQPWEVQHPVQQQFDSDFSQQPQHFEL